MCFMKTGASSQTHTKYILSILSSYLPQVYIYFCLTASFFLLEYFIKSPKRRL